MSRFVALVFVLGAFGALGPWSTAAGAATDAVVVTDTSGDVMLGQPGSGAPAPSSQGLDILEAKLFRESGESFLVQVKLADLMAEQTTGAALAPSVNACFTVGDKLFAARLTLTYNPAPFPTTRTIGPLNGACNPAAALVFQNSVATLPVSIDTKTNTITLMIKRSVIGLSAKSTPPVAGESVKDFRVFMTDGKRSRFDLAPETGVAPGALTFSTNTANVDLKATVDDNTISQLHCAGQPDLPGYAIQAGGKRGVPVILQNLQSVSRTVTLTVDTLDGQNWKPAMLPKIEVPGAESGKTGNVTVTVITDTPASTKHKECTTLRVRATDADAPSTLGEAIFNVIAVSPPSREQRRLFLHGNVNAKDACINDNVWLNTLASDPDESDPAVLMVRCHDTSVVSDSQITLDPRIDVNPSHDLVLNTSAVGAKATAILRFRSDGPPTTARIDVTVISGMLTFVALGQGKATAQLDSTAKDVRVDIPIDFTRDSVATGDPSRVVDAHEGIGMLIRYTPLPADGNLPLSTAGRVFFLPKGSSLELPIFATIKRNTNDPGAGGSLLSISAPEPLPEFAAPGSLRLFNFSVLNEGAKADIAVVSAAVSGPAGWTAEVYPSQPLTLGPGERAPVQVGVRPRADAQESETALLDVVVTSQNDATARASMSSRVVASREAGIPVESAPTVLEHKDKGLLPGPGLPILFALVALVGFALRRRR